MVLPMPGPLLEDKIFHLRTEREEIITFDDDAWGRCVITHMRTVASRPVTLASSTRYP